MKRKMADLPTSFWGGWITVLTVTSMAGLVWLLLSVYFSKSKHEEGVVWDETLNEGSHPAPMWWFWLILALMVFSVIYLILYPGLGTYGGTLKWSQSGRLDQSYEFYHQRYDSIRNSILATPFADLQEDEYIMKTAKGIFDRNCAVCHGADGRGQAFMFPDLMDGIWQWGGSVAQIEHSIRQGREAVMPGWGTVLGEQGTMQLIGYIRELGQGTATTDADPGKTSYNQYCAACHGITGTGNIALGAPDLTNGVWLYGDTDNDLIETIANGRRGIMPGFEKRLDNVQIRLLIAWLTRRAE